MRKTVFGPKAKMIKEMISAALGKLGYEITRKDRGGFYSSYLAKICAPKTVFDVGVGRGTPELYGAYPGTRFFLIEPLEEFKEALKQISGRIDCVIYNKALSDMKGTVEINIEHDPQLSSFAKGQELISLPGKDRWKLLRLTQY